MIDRDIPKFRPIEKDEKNKEGQYFCVGCGGITTQTAFFKIEGAVIVERYCDVYALKLNELGELKNRTAAAKTWQGLAEYGIGPIRRLTSRIVSRLTIILSIVQLRGCSLYWVQN